jgi:hypothetical protein
MSVLTNYLVNKWLEHQFRSATYTKPSVLYVGLIASVSNIKAGTVTELSGGGYARVATTVSDAEWSAPDANGKTSNIIGLAYPIATGNWVEATHWGFWDAASNGNLLICSTLTTPRTVTTNTTPVFGIGTLEVQLDG